MVVTWLVRCCECRLGTGSLMECRQKRRGEVERDSSSASASMRDVRRLEVAHLQRLSRRGECAIVCASGAVQDVGRSSQDTPETDMSSGTDLANLLPHANAARRSSLC